MFSSRKTAAPSSGGYNLTKSLRFRSSASAYLSRTPTVASNQTTWTFSSWIKLGALATGSNQAFFAAGNGSSTTYLQAFFDGTSQALSLTALNSSSVVMQKISTAVYRDPAAWYHVVLAYDSTQTTSTNRIKIYVNGSQVTSFSTNTDPASSTTTLVNSANQHTLSSLNYSSRLNYFDGYQTEINFIDGQALTPSSFGSTNSLTGVWQPAKYTGTYGTNGFYLPFTNITSTSTLGNDSSGNGNNWTTNNISLTTGSTYDSMYDVPTLTSATVANYAVLNVVAPSSYRTLTNGNLRATGNTATNSGMSVATMGVSTGKIVWEETINTVSGSFPGIGCTTAIPSDGNGVNMGSAGYLGIYYRANGDIYKNSSSLVGSYTALSATNVVRFELDVDALTCAIYRNNTLVVTVTGLTAGTFFPANVQYNGSITDINFGQQPWVNTPNTGFLALNTYNL